MTTRNTLVELKAMCSAKGLATSGSKTTLLAHLADPANAPKGKKRKASSSSAAEPEALVVRTAIKAGALELLECLRPDELTPAMEGGVLALLKRLGPLPQLAYNSGEEVPWETINPECYGSTEPCGVSCFAGCVFLEGYGPLMLTKIGTHYMCSVSTMILSVRKDDTPRGCGKPPSFGGAGFSAAARGYRGPAPKGKKSFSTPPKSISVFALSYGECDDYTPPRAKLVDAIRRSMNAATDIGNLPDEIVLAAIAAAAICANEGATVGEWDKAPAPDESVIKRIFDAVKSTAASASHPYDANRGGTPLHNKAQKKIYNKTMKNWLALSNHEVGSELQRVRTAEAAEAAAADAADGGGGGGGAAASSMSSSSSSSSSSIMTKTMTVPGTISSAAADAGVKRQKITASPQDGAGKEGNVDDKEE